MKHRTSYVHLALFMLPLCGVVVVGGCKFGHRDPGSTAVDSGSSTASNLDAEKYYQQLLHQHGENFSACVKEVEVKLNEAPMPSGSVAEQPKQLNVLIALDASGSMNGSVGGGKKIEVAREAIARFVGSLPKESKVGLIVFGHRGSNREPDKSISCAGIETVYEIRPLDQALFQRSVESFRPTGYTPIAGALEHSSKALSAFVNEANRNLIYVVTDGIETCGGDPVAVARSMHGSSIKALINVIGFDVDNAAQRQLRAVAEAGGGSFYVAQNAGELNKAFDDSLQQHRSWFTNVQNQNRVWTAFTNASNAFWVCITNKMNKEAITIQNALNAVPPHDPKYQYVDDAGKRLRERHDQIEAWKKGFIDNLDNRKDLTIDQLKQELAKVAPE